MISAKIKTLIIKVEWIYLKQYMTIEKLPRYFIIWAVDITAFLDFVADLPHGTSVFRKHNLINII